MAKIHNVLPPRALATLETASRDHAYVPFSTATYSTDEGMQEEILTAYTSSKNGPDSRHKRYGSPCDLGMTSLPGMLAQVHRIEYIESDTQSAKDGTRQIKSTLQNSSREYMAHCGAGFMRMHIYVVHETADVIYDDGKYSYCWRVVNDDDCKARTLWHKDILANSSEDNSHFPIQIAFDKAACHLKKAGHSGLVRLIMGVYSEDDQYLESKLSPPIRVVSSSEAGAKDKITFKTIGRAQSTGDKYIPGLKLGIEEHLPSCTRPDTTEDPRKNNAPISVNPDLPSNSSGSKGGAEMTGGAAPLEFQPLNLDLSKLSLAPDDNDSKQAMDGSFATGDNQGVPVDETLYDVSQQFSALQLYEHELGRKKRERQEDTDGGTKFAQERTETPVSPTKRVRLCRACMRANGRPYVPRLPKSLLV